MSHLSRLANVKSVGLLAAAGLLAGGAGAMSPAAAVPQPTSGTVSDSHRTVQWNGNPPFVNNVTGTAGPVDCTVPNSCDDYTLHVKTPSGYSDTHQLKISVGFQDVSGQQTSGSDFDVYLLDSKGNSVSSAATSNNPEVMVVAPKAGTYRVRVVPYTVTGTEKYAAKATILDKKVNPPESPLTPPKMQSFGAPEQHNGQFYDSHNAGEPSIGNSWKTGSTFYQALFSTYKANFVASGIRGPATVKWADVSANAAKGCPQGSTTSLDPIMWTDHQTGRTIESQLSGENSLACLTDDEGKTWQPSEGGPGNSGVDHQTIGGGNFVGGKNPTAPVNGYPNAVYYCSQDIATAFCGRSDDGGQKFNPGIPTYNTTQCGGLHGHIKVAPDGTAYLPNKGCGQNQAVAVSEDNGMSWQVRKVPQSTSGDSDPSVGIGRNGTVYFGYVGADAVPRIAVSHDKGKTWRHDQAVGTGFGRNGIQSAVFPAVVAGDSNRAAFAYLGTTTPGDYQSIPNFNGIWHLYVSYTYDGGKSWSTRIVQPNDPVQRGSICTGGTTCGNNRNLLDFMDVTIDKQGHVLVGYADGCTRRCVTTPKLKNNDAGAPYHDAYARIARQYTGKTLFAKYDPKFPNLMIRSIERHIGTVNPNRSKLVARVFNNGTKIARHAVVTWYVNRHYLGTTGGAAVRKNHGHPVRIRWNTGGLHGKQHIKAVVDLANNIKELNEKDNVAHRTFTVR